MIGEQVITVDTRGKPKMRIGIYDGTLVYAVDMGYKNGYDMYLIAIREITTANCDKVHGVMKALL